jgi:hypothetical protein
MWSLPLGPLTASNSRCRIRGTVGPASRQTALHLSVSFTVERPITEDKNCLEEIFNGKIGVRPCRIWRFRLRGGTLSNDEAYSELATRQASPDSVYCRVRRIFQRPGNFPSLGLTSRDIPARSGHLGGGGSVGLARRYALWSMERTLVLKAFGRRFGRVGERWFYGGKWCGG